MSQQQSESGVVKSVPTAPTAMQRWFPIGAWLASYDWGKFFAADLIAAVSLAALLIPEAMGLSSVAGVPVQIGLYAAPLALIGYAMFGGSRLLVFAAAGSTAAVSASVVGGLAGGDQDTAVTLTAALALTTGAVFLVAGIAKLGWVTNFISKAVMAGFITGLSIQIIVGQFGKLFGIELSGDNTFEKLWSAVSQIGDWNWTAVIIGVGSLVLILAIGRFIPKLPAYLTAVVVASVIVAVFDPDIDLVAAIPQGLPSFTLPTGIDASTWGNLLAGGAVVALVGFSEGWGASQSVARQTHDQLDSDQEFRAYGVGNIGAGLLGGMVVAGSLSKSSTAMSAGAKSQMANILLAVIVLLTLAFLAPAFQWLPETVLAAIVIATLLGSASPRALLDLQRVDNIDFAFGVITFSLVLVTDLLPAMVAGVIMSVIYMIYRISFPGREVLGRIADTGDYTVRRWITGKHQAGVADTDAEEPPGVMVYRFSAPLIFSNAEAFKATGEYLLIEAAAKGPLPHTLVIDMEEVLYADSTGASAVSDLAAYTQRYGIQLALARVHPKTKQVFQVSGAIEVGDHRVFDTVRDAVAAAAASGGEKSRS